MTSSSSKFNNADIKNNFFIEFNNVCKTFKNGKNVVLAADKLSFTANEGEFIMIIGPSGSGKTTLLNMLGGMEYADSGNIYISGKDVTKFSNSQLEKHRSNTVGFVYQFYNLLPNLTTAENIKLACDAAKTKCDINKYIKAVDLESYANSFPSQMSGGQQQRIAIARAIAKNPKVLLCDEPTGALDSKNSESILKLLRKITDDGVTILMVTHNLDNTKYADRVIEIKDGKVSSTYSNKK